MLGNSAITPTIPVKDLERAKDFYSNTLGLEIIKDDPYGPVYECGGGTALMIYESAGAGTSEATYAGWQVEDLDAEMEDLREKGVEFEEYDMPGLKTTAGVAESGGMRSAWFKDPDGNILALAEMG